MNTVITLDKIRAEIHATAEMHEDGVYYLRDEWIDEIIDKYRADKEIKVNEKESLNVILDEIKAEIIREYKWLMNTRHTIRDVDIAFSGIFLIIDKYKAESEEENEVIDNEDVYQD